MPVKEIKEEPIETKIVEKIDKSLYNELELKLQESTKNLEALTARYNKLFKLYANLLDTYLQGE